MTLLPNATRQQKKGSLLASSPGRIFEFAAPRLERETQANSHNTRLNACQTLGLAELRAAEVALDAVKVRVVEHVLSIDAEAQVDGLSEFERLVNAKIQVRELRAVEHIASQCAEAQVSGSGSWIARSHKETIRCGDSEP